MITVSASAVRLLFGIPAQTKWYPEDMRFVLVVLVVGAVVVTLAILGFKRLAQFAVVCSPWMVLMFVAGAVVMLPALASVLPDGRIDGVARPLDDRQPDDLEGRLRARLRRASASGTWSPSPGSATSRCTWASRTWRSSASPGRSSYGLFSAFGMFVGHYLAWICAGIMGAAAAFAGPEAARAARLRRRRQPGARRLRAPSPSCIAGWTTANPTLYRAGLALQVVTPNWPRWKVTLIAGAVTTLMACSPFVFTKLLDFVGVYGLLLMPVGAIVFVEHWIFPRIGLHPVLGQPQGARRELAGPRRLARLGRPRRSWPGRAGGSTSSSWRFPSGS